MQLINKTSLVSVPAILIRKRSEELKKRIRLIQIFFNIDACLANGFNHDTAFGLWSIAPASAEHLVSPLTLACDPNNAVLTRQS